MPKFLKKAANLGPCCELVFHFWSNFSQWKMMKITYFTSIDDLSRDRTQDQGQQDRRSYHYTMKTRLLWAWNFVGFIQLLQGERVLVVLWIGKSTYTSTVYTIKGVSPDKNVVLPLVFNTVVSPKIMELIPGTFLYLVPCNWFQLQYLISVTIPDFSSITVPGNGTDISSITSSIPLFQLLCGLDLVMELINCTGTSNGTENKNKIWPSNGTEIRYIPDTE